eukprot:gene669-17426_t
MTKLTDPSLPGRNVGRGKGDPVRNVLGALIRQEAWLERTAEPPAVLGGGP